MAAACPSPEDIHHRGCRRADATRCGSDAAEKRASVSDSSLAVDSEAEASLASSTAISPDSFMLEPAPTGSRIDSLTRRADSGNKEATCRASARQ